MEVTCDGASMGKRAFLLTLAKLCTVRLFFVLALLRA